MAKKKETEEKQPEGVLATAAKAIGKAAGKAAKLTGAAADAPAADAPAVDAPPPQPKKVKVPKLAPKNKARLPRKVKKAQQKQKAKQSA
jgi:hypothetical protein